MLRPQWLWLLLLLVFPFGCGGGTSPNAGGTPPVTSGVVSAKQRAAALDAVLTKFHSQPRVNQQADAQDMLAFLRSRPEFVHADISDDGCVWAWFADLQPICVVYNELLQEPPDRSARMPATLQSRTRSSEIPNGKRAVLLQMFGFVDALLFNPRPQIHDVLFAAGYSMEEPTPASVGFFRSMGTVDVLFTNGHGGLGFKQGDPTDEKHFWPHYCLWTDQKVLPESDQSDAILQEDLKYVPAKGGQAEQRPRVVIMFAEVAHLDLRGHQECHYAITSEFVKKYMSFGKNSLWINNACGGDDAELKAACFSNKLGGYIGWNESVQRATANTASKYIVDRLAGEKANVDPGVDKENPLQRAFDVGLILTGMAAKNPRLDRSYAIENGIQHLAFLHFTPNPDQIDNHVGLLAPSIEHLEVVATGSNQTELRLFGSFGNSQGSVTVGGKTLPLASEWKSNQLRCVLPAHDAEGGGGHGDVVVTVGGHPSTPVQLTLWEITFDETFKRNWSGQYIFQQPMAPDFTTYYAQPSGNLTIATQFKVYVRGDAHLYRGLPGQKPPFDNPARIFVISVQGNPTKDAKVSSTSVSGSASEKHTNDKNSNTQTYFNTFSLEGGSSIALDGSDNRAQIGSITGMIDPTKKQLGIVYSVFFDPIVHIDESSNPPGSGGIGMAPTNGGISFPANYGNNLIFDLDDTYNVVGGSKQASDSVPLKGYTDTYTISWSSQVFDAPKADVARSVKNRAAKR